MRPGEKQNVKSREDFCVVGFFIVMCFFVLFIFLNFCVGRCFLFVLFFRESNLPFSNSFPAF